MFEALKLRQESRAELAQWYLQLWLLMHTLLYTRYNRALSDVSRYQEATFAGAELVELMRDQLETLRSLGEEAPESSRVLLEERGEDISRRVRAFIDLQVRAGLLEGLRDAEASAGAEESVGEVWQQTLLGALESEQIGIHQLGHLQALAQGRAQGRYRGEDAYEADIDEHEETQA